MVQGRFASIQGGSLRTLCRTVCHVLIVSLVMMTGRGVMAAPPPAKPGEPIEMRSGYGVPDAAAVGAEFLTQLRILDRFEKYHPHIKPLSSTGLQIPGNQADMIPMMQIAGDIAPEVMYVNFRQSDTYIRNRFLYPLDKYLEKELGLKLPNGHLLNTDAYIEKLKTSPAYATFEMADRVPRRVWDVMRRECPQGEKCPHVEAGATKAAHHYHVWAFPQGVKVTTLFFRKDLFSEAGIEEKVPATLDEMYEIAKTLTNPREDRFGFNFNNVATGSTAELGWKTLSILYSYGGRVVKQDEKGDWQCCFDDEAAVNAYYFVARLFAEPFENKHGKFTSVIAEPRPGAVPKIAMYFGALDEKYFATTTDPELEGFGPIPAGPNGVQGNELNATMTGIYAGLENDPVRRQAAWDFMWFYDGPEARKIRAGVYVESGAGRYLSSKLLKEAGFPEYIRQIPKGWEEAQAKAIETGVPEPYGRNCQQVYRFLSEAVDQIRTDAETTAAIQSHDAERAKNRIRQILKMRVASSNEKMLNIITPEQRVFRNRVASVVGILILLAFAYTFYTVFKAFGRNQIAAVPEARPAPPPGWSGFPQRIFFQYLGMGRAHKEYPVHPSRRGHWQIDRYKWAYLVLLPALGSILLWAYYPLARGTFMAFQDYNVRGFSTWVGMDNFANVLFDAEFWHAMWTSLKYAGLYLLFGFFTPIILAFLLTEVPRGKIFFRTLYYLPAVLSGAVVIFLWKGFYGRYGLINQFLNLFVSAFNNIGYWLSQWLPLTGDPIAPFNKAWLDNPQMALFFCLLPTIWAGMGPGCLIYLAALKTVPDEFYEAAEIDGAGIWSKLRHVSIPGIRGLIAINFIGALIGTIHGGSEMVLAMTGGGPYTPYGATEVIGLHIFWQSFGYLRFGPATAMAWILGAMLIGFTVLQLKRLSRMEFRRAGPTAGEAPKG